MSEELRMDAYFYSFDPTGCPVIDEVLSAVATAGKRYHQTEDWTDEGQVEEIQLAAIRAAAEVDRLRAQVSRVEAEIGDYCDNYRAPLNCLSAPSSLAGRCHFCRIRAALAEPAEAKR